MSDEYLTKQEVADLMGMKPDSIANYTSGRVEPKLKAKRVIVKGKERGSQVKLMIRRTDFEAWRVEYEAKKPFGAKLHKDKAK